MHDLQGQTFVVTGANAGIGRATAEALAARGGRVILCGRSAERTEPVLDHIRRQSPAAEVDFVRLDLASLAATAEAAEELLARVPRIDVLVANAGLAGHRGQTEDGFEIQFGVNHLGHFLLTLRLLPRLLDASPSRVVVVSSENHRHAKGIDFDAVQRTTDTAAGLREYGVSKLANVLFAKELARRYGDRGLTATSLHPGVVASDVWRRIPWPIRPIFIKLARMKSNEEGAATSLHCATAPLEELENGGYYDEHGNRARAQALAQDRDLADELWRRSEDWVRPWLPA